MKQIIALIFSGLIAACTANEFDGPEKCYTLIERQCAMDPFNSYYKDIKTLEDRAAAIAGYLKDQGISNPYVKANPLSTDAVCQACTCPSGYSYQLKVSESDTTKLNTLNLLLVSRNCD